MSGTNGTPQPDPKRKIIAMQVPADLYSQMLNTLSELPYAKVGDLMSDLRNTAVCAPVYEVPLDGKEQG